MIEVQNLSFSYPGASSKVFDGFQLKLESGHTYGLLGRNGTGKSTLLYLASGLLRPKKGHLYIDGMESAQRDPLMLSRIFLVPEEFSLPEMSLQKYVSLIRPFYPRFNEQVLNDCLSAFELPDVRDLRQLSMGQKKKVFMSVALAAGTEWLLMDEPTNGLDIPSKRVLRKLLAGYADERRTVVVSTHQVRDIEEMIDNVVILDSRGMVLNRTVAEISGRMWFGPVEASDHAIYAEEGMDGLRGILENPAGSDSRPDLEMLFNAAVSEREAVRQLFDR